MTRKFEWQEHRCFYGKKCFLLVCVSDPRPCAENPYGRQIVGDVYFQKRRFGAQTYCYKARVWWDRGDDGRPLPDGPSSHATVGNTKAAKRWVENWLSRQLWQWDGCEVVNSEV